MQTIVTGAGRNIGKGIAKSLVADGHDCILIDKDEQLLEQLISELPADKAKPCVLDISDTKAIDAFMNWLDSNHIEVDALINNVGKEPEESLLELTPEIIEESNSTNLTGPFYLTSQVAKRMRKGSIIFISSVHSKVIRTHPLYSASKAAIEMFVKEAALELADKGIRVNAIAPGPVKDTKQPEENKYVPLGSFLQPEDIGEAVKFLVSDSAKNITGTTIVVDGGFTLAHTHYWKNKDIL
jgi:3-oxoacyl-[acyl-carrier protein] reductase